MPQTYIEEVLGYNFEELFPDLKALPPEHCLFLGSIVVCAALGLRTRGIEFQDPEDPPFSPAETSQPTSPSRTTKDLVQTEQDFASLRWRYLAVYVPSVFGDWIQGAYVYALYRAYDLHVTDISHLFITGYASSAILGTYIASLGDRYGHRRCVMLYGVLYALSCVTMHSHRLAVLVLGRILGGVSYSLLYSSFEAWVVADASARGQRHLLARLFPAATFANASSAVMAGILGEVVMTYGLPAGGAGGGGGGGTEPPTAPVAAPLPGGGAWAAAEGWWAWGANEYTRPFDAAVVALLLGALGAGLLWTEHRGGGYQGTGSSGMAAGSMRQAAATILGHAGLRAVMMIIAFYEASLYVFVFLWTPVLEARAGGAAIPHGIIFSLFMCCKMAGSQLFVLLCGPSVTPARCLSWVFALSLACFAVPLVTQGYMAALLAFCLYEAGLGLYWPAIALLRAELIPDDTRSTMASLFRVPLNVLVVCCLLAIGRTSEALVLVVCCCKLGICLYYAVTLSVAPGQHEVLRAPGTPRKSHDMAMQA